MAISIILIFIGSVMSVEETLHNLDNPYFDYSKFYYKKDNVNIGKEFCFKSECVVSPSQCIRREEEALRLFFSGCPQGKKCLILSDYSGKCVDDFPKNNLVLLYPGDKCTPERKDNRVCAYGKRM